MTRTTASRLVVALLALASSRAVAQEDAERDRCIALYDALRVENNWPDVLTSDAARARACDILALQIRESRRTLRPPTSPVSRADVQAIREGSAAASGTPAQATSVPGVEPVEQGGASVAATGTRAGAGAILSMAINPAIFFADQTDLASLARFNRLADVSVLVPVDGVDADSNGVVDYVGLRVRINIGGLEAGSAQHAAVLRAYDAVLNEASAEVATIRRFIRGSNRLDCIRALLVSADGQVRTACGEDFTLVTAALEEQLARAIEDARIENDNRYFGLDLRADFGDLRLGGIDTTAGSSIYAGVAYGLRNVDVVQQSSLGVRTRLGVAMFDPRAVDAAGIRGARFSVDGGAGFEINRYYGHQRLTLSTGLEFRWGFGSDADSSATPSSLDHGVIRSALNVPLFDGTSVSLALGIPVWGDVGPTLSVNANWRLLRAAPRRGR